MNELLAQAKRKSEAIFDQYEAWDQDQDKDAQDREGIPHPGAEALSLARDVRHLPDYDE